MLLVYWKQEKNVILDFQRWYKISYNRYTRCLFVYAIRLVLLLHLRKIPCGKELTNFKDHVVFLFCTVQYHLRYGVIQCANIFHIYFLSIRDSSFWIFYYCDSVAWADAFVLVSPDYHGSMSSVMKNFLDHFWEEFAGKVFGYICTSHEKGLTVMSCCL